jgi:chromosome partitioning protein
MTRRISVLNFKGGVGKSSLAINLAHALVRLGSTALLIDCDLQANTSTLLPDVRPPTLTHVLKRQAPLTASIQKARERLFIVPSDNELDTALPYVDKSHRRLLDHATQQLKVDYIFFDHPPSYTDITEAGLLASEEVLVPCELTPFSMQGLQTLFTKLAVKMSEYDHDLIIAGIVPYKFDLRYSMNVQYLPTLRQQYGAMVSHPIRTDSTVSRAQSFGQTVYEYDPMSRVAHDFTRLARQLAEQKVKL